MLATAGVKRSPQLPDVPTIAESMPGFEVSAWFGVVVPTKTQTSIVNRLNSEILKSLQDPEVASRLAQEGAVLLGSTPDEYGAYLKSELERWTNVVKSNNIKVE